jgi:hypothetical protein
MLSCRKDEAKGMFLEDVCPAYFMNDWFLDSKCFMTAKRVHSRNARLPFSNFFSRAPSSCSISCHKIKINTLYSSIELQCQD